MLLSIITPERILFSDAVVQATLPGLAGEFGALQGHEPLVSALKPGVIVLEKQGGGTETFATLGGVAQVSADAISVLLEHAKALANTAREALETELASAKSAHAQASPEEAWIAEHRVELAQIALSYTH